MSRSKPRPNYIGDTPNYINKDHYAAEHLVEPIPYYGWTGRKEPEWKREDEADNLPGSAEQAGHEQLHEGEN